MRLAKDYCEFEYTIDEISVGELLAFDVLTFTDYEEVDGSLHDIGVTRVIEAFIFVDDDSWEQRRMATRNECKEIAKAINDDKDWEKFFVEKLS